MITLTKEWLLKTIAELEEERDATPGAVNEDAAMALAAMKLALASLEAEPVDISDDMAYAFHHALSDSSLGADDVDEIKTGLRAVFANITAPPAPVSDSLLSELLGIAKRAAYEADECAHAEFSDDSMEHSAAIADWERRAAMLQGVENAETPTTMQTAPALDSSPKIAESPTGINQGKSEPVTTAYKLPFEQWLSQQTGTIDVECGCVMTEVFFHWLRVAYEAGNSPQCREISNSSTNNFRENAETSTKCWCRTCRPVTFADSHFVVCPECGNKRCPHANDHRHACTGSNEPGQEGSAYPAAPQQEVTQALAKGMERYGDAMQELAKKEVK